MTLRELFDNILIDYCKENITVNSIDSIIKAITECEDYKTHAIEEKGYNKYDMYIRLMCCCTWSYCICFKCNDNNTISLRIIYDFDRKMMYRNN